MLRGPVPRPLRPPTVVAAGRLSNQKGFDLLVDAFRPVAADHPRWRLDIHGRGPDEAALRARVHRHGIDRRVRLRGATADLDRAFDGASMFVLSSRFEGFGMVLVEAMARGLPVVSFDCPYGPAEIIRSPDEGVLVPPGDVAALAGAVSRLATDPARRRRLGAAARARAADFAPDGVARAWEDLFTRLLATRAEGKLRF